MSLCVTYRVPLMVEVEPSRGEVLSVHVVDESIEGPKTVVDGSNRAVSPKKRRKAIRIAETTMWPSWTFGS